MLRFFIVYTVYTAEKNVGNVKKKSKTNKGFST